jgi:TPR repeat protein
MKTIIRTSFIRFTSALLLAFAVYLPVHAQPTLTPEQVQMVRKAANNGNVEGMIIMGNMYVAGRNGLHQNYKEAISWYGKAADKGNTEAMNTIGRMYYMGEGLPQDYSKAVIWYRKAAQAGDPWAKKILREFNEPW